MLPSIRQDLSLHDGPMAQDGSPTWVLHDPAANRFYSLSWSAFEILSRWGLGEPAALLAAVNRQTTLRVDEEDLSSVVEFLMRHDLLEAQSATDTARLLEAAHAGKLSIPQWMLRHYLFVRVPLLRPARFLEWCAPGIAWVYQPAFWVAMALTAILGLALASRQWETFVGTFSQYKSVTGMLAIAGALMLAKALHELGHAFTALRYGCRVPTMGVAFLVMLPVLYTDTNEAWKLADKSQRLKIAAAGMLAELALAAVSTVAWSFLPDGPVRGGVFLLATTTWILTLGINASPFMRFDGYFLLCDWLDMPNLHNRAFALGRWWLRRVLFGWEESPPESFRPARRIFLIGFALTTWVYRFGLFLGIAYLVYDSVFKVLGVILLFVELFWFIALPIYREIEVWWQRRGELEWNIATGRSAAAAGVSLLLLFVPLTRDVRAPAVLGAAQSQVLYAVAAGRVIAAPVSAGERVSAGQLLVQLDSPDLEHQLALAESRVHSIRAQLDRQPFEPKLLAEGAALHERWAAAVADVTGLHAQVEELLVRAPFDGVAVDINEGLAVGAWVAVHEKLLHVTSSGGAKGEMLLSEEDLGRVGQREAVFFAERTEQGRIACHLGDIDRINLVLLDSPYLASTYGGAVRVQADAGGALVPSESVFRARLVDCRSEGAPTQELRGTAHLTAPPVSVAGLILRRAIVGIQRELGR